LTCAIRFTPIRSTWGPFNDGDKNTLIVDLDGTLTGFEVVHGRTTKVDNAISLNNLPFNATAVRPSPAMRS
jgi:hypothetical protein